MPKFYAKILLKYCFFDVYIFLRYVRDEGLVSAEQYPYTAEENPQCLIEGGQYRIKDVKYISRNSEAIADFVFSEGPVSVGNAISLLK